MRRNITAATKPFPNGLDCAYAGEASDGEDAMTAEPHRTGGAWSALIAGGALALALIVGSVALRPPAEEPAASQAGPIAAPVAPAAAANEMTKAPEMPKEAALVPAQPAKAAATQRAVRARTSVMQSPPMQSARLFIERPRWIEEPNGRTRERYYPKRSRERLGEARVTLLCNVDGGGRLACAVESEQPRGSGFAEAAQRLARHYRMAPTLEDGRSTAGAQTRLNMTFRADR
jgi:hypothetical protein